MRLRWAECGVGPLRLNLQTQTSKTESDEAKGETKSETGTARARLVMRRENQPGGHGTKLLLNVALFPGFIVTKADSANSIRFVAVDADGKLQSYLLKVGRGDLSVDDVLRLIDKHKSVESS